MISILTPKELRFLKEFCCLIEKYGILFSTDNNNGINITVHEGNVIQNDNSQTNIRFEDSFDQNELKDLLEENAKLMKEIVDNYKPEE